MQSKKFIFKKSHFKKRILRYSKTCIMCHEKYFTIQEALECTEFDAKMIKQT